MKTKLLFMFVIVAIALIPTKMFAQATQTVSGSAKIMTPITLTKTADLHFGTLTSAATLGTCVLSTSSATRTPSGGVALVAATPTPSNAAFTVGGQGGAAYTITLPTDVTVLFGTESMTISDFKIKAASAASEGAVGTIAAGGTDTFVIGGTLNVGASQVAGVYTADFNVSVTYN